MSVWRFPSPYADELGYGLIGRYFGAWGDLDRQGLLNGLTQRKVFNTHPATVPGLPRVAAAAFPTEPDPVSIFVRRHTLLPYAMAMKPPERQTILLAAIGEETEASTSRLTLTASAHSWPRTMQLCSACLKEDVHGRRTPYWRRTHHVPGIAHCLRHGLRLHATSAPFALGRAAKAATPLSVSCSFSAESEVRPLFCRSLERALIEPSLAALKGRLTLPVKGTVSYYRNIIRKIDGQGVSGGLNFSGVHWTFTHWLKLRGCEETSVGKKEWLKPLLTNVQGSPSTLQHLLLRAFLRDKGPWKVS